MPKRARAAMERGNSKAKRMRRVLGVFHCLGTADKPDRTLSMPAILSMVDHEAPQRRI